MGIIILLVTIIGIVLLGRYAIQEGQKIGSGNPKPPVSKK